MSDEISEVKKVSIDFVRKTLQKKDISFTYILVPFSDPGKLLSQQLFVLYFKKFSVQNNSLDLTLILLIKIGLA